MSSEMTANRGNARKVTGIAERDVTRLVGCCTVGVPGSTAVGRRMGRGCPGLKPGPGTRPLPGRGSQPP